MLRLEKGDKNLLPQDEETKVLGKRIEEAYKFWKTILHHPTLMLDNDGEAASVEFRVQLVESQYRAFISEGDFLNNRGSEEEIVFLSSKDGEPTTRASSNREEDAIW